MSIVASAPIDRFTEPESRPDSPALTLPELADVTRRIASTGPWKHVVRHDPDRRFAQRVVATPAYDGWLIGWSPGHAVPAHDHGSSLGALVVIQGRLSETSWLEGSDEPRTRTVAAGGGPLLFEAGHVHAVANLHDAPATSIHLYSPPLDTMRWFDGVGTAPTARAVSPDAPRPERRSVETLLRAARGQLERLQPDEAFDAARGGALLVDTRPEAYRHAEGHLPGAVLVERNDLEWRLDPSSPDRLTEMRDHDTPVILVCNEGYASSLAAAALQGLGLSHVTDLDGGFRAWKRAGLPTVNPSSR